jgi:hypothetical protein
MSWSRSESRSRMAIGGRATSPSCALRPDADCRGDAGGDAGGGAHGDAGSSGSAHDEPQAVGRRAFAVRDCGEPDAVDRVDVLVRLAAETGYQGTRV